MITKDDSYQAGNCRPGTSDFIKVIGAEHLGMVDGGLSARDIAKAWRKAGYPQINLFSNVVNRVAKSYETQPTA